MVSEIRLPPLGQTSDEMSIVEWYKKVGDVIAIAEPLLCVETDKANVDVESAEEGVILQILAEPGELLPSGSLLAYVGAPGESLLSVDSMIEPASTPTIDVKPEEAASAPKEIDLPAPMPDPASQATMQVRVQAAPAVRKLAAELGVNLAAITGTGSGGSIGRHDVEAAAAATSHGQAASSAEGGSDLTPVSPVRRVIARRLAKSAQTIPTFRLSADLNAGAAKRSMAAYGPGLTYTHLLLRSVARALREHPVMMRLWVEDGPSFRTLTAPNVGLAVAGDDSLFVVTVPTPDTESLAELVGTVGAAVERGRRGVLIAQDQHAASITVSNLGMLGISSFDAIIDPDQNAILAAGAVRDVVVVVDEAFTVRPLLSVTLSCDHRAVDGAQAARFLRTLQGYFESDPDGVTTS